MNKQTSNRITLLRVTLIIFVIFSHNNSTVIHNTEASYCIKTLISEMVGRVAVPLFFFISGYLLFLKNTPYTVVLKKKAKTLLVPYLLWNTIVIGMFFVGQNAPYISRFFNDESNQITNYTLYQWLDAYLGLNYHGYPIAYQFWFIRDLMIFTILFPVGKWLVDHLPRVTLIAMAAVWIMQWRVLVMDGEAALFFLLGYYVVKYDTNFEKIDRLKFRYLFLAYIPILVVEMVLLLRGDEFILFHKIGIGIGCVIWMKLSKCLTSRESWCAKTNALAGYSFFIYAFHEPFMTMLRKVWAVVIPLEGTAWQMIQYFGLVAVVAVISLIVGWCVNRVSPGLYALLTGGRTAGRKVKI